MGTAVVTGATGGIGSAIVRALASRGDQVLAVARSAAALDQLCSGVELAVPVQIDLGKPFEVHPALTATEQVDVLVHCAAVADVAAVEETPWALWEEIVRVNLVAAAELTRLLLPALRSVSGRVVFINAAVGVTAVPRWSAFAGSKAALRELADSLREEEATHGIRVTTIYPDGTATERLRIVRAQFGRPFDPERCISPETLASLVVSVVESPADAYLSELTVRATPRP